MSIITIHFRVDICMVEAIQMGDVSHVGHQSENAQPEEIADSVPAGGAKSLKSDASLPDKASTGDEVQPVTYHCLQSSWSLWFKRDNPGNSWPGSQKKVHTFETVEDFWSLFNYIQPANMLTKGCDYSLFKNSIEPSWEDPRNSSGGRWILTMNKKHWDEKTNIDKYWLETVLLLIGEGFEDLYGDSVVGAVVSIRAKVNRVAVWITTTDRDASHSIGQTFKSRLKLSPATLIHFQTHKDAQQQTSSASKHMFTL
jgi:translation initiation factor 4E